MPISVGSVITTSDYNDIRNTIDDVLNATADGYGVGLLENTTATSNILVSQLHIGALYRDVNKCIKHQTGANISGISLPAQGDTITAAFLSTLATSATIAVTNVSQVHPSQLATAVSATYFTRALWSIPLQVERTYSWDSNLEANYHFNLGGYLTTTIGYEGTPASTADNGFVEFVNHANASYSTLITPYNRSNWRGVPDTVTRTYSTNTVAGVFTATVIYSRTSTGLVTTSTITPPGGTGGINLDAISSATLYYSTDAISAERPGIVTSRKILSVSSLQPFTFKAGQRSSAQILVLSNVSAEPISISEISASANGVRGFVCSTATNLSEDFPLITPITYPLVINSAGTYEVAVFYEEPLTAIDEVGVFYNNITINSDADKPKLIVNTVQSVTYPDFDFDLVLLDEALSYTYDNWATEYSLSTGNKNKGISIANTYFLSDTDFGVINGVRRYGLYRRPTSEELKFWLDYTNAQAGGNVNAIAAAFFTSIDNGGPDSRRSRLAQKFFDPGFGQGDFYDRTFVNLGISDANPKVYNYRIVPKFGSIVNNGFFSPGYTFSLSNQQYNGSPLQTEVFQATYNFGFFFSNSKGPNVIYYPAFSDNIGTYSTDLTVTVTARNLSGAIVTVSKTVNLGVILSALSDINYVNWISPSERTNGILGISYDRIGGIPYLTVGVGLGADGSAELDSFGSDPGYLASHLGVNGDVYHARNEVGYNLPVYKAAYQGVYSQLLNDYGVWFTNPPVAFGGSIPIEVYIVRYFKFTAPYAGTYSVAFSADNRGYIDIDGVRVVDRTFTNDGSNYSQTHTGSIYLNQGTHTIQYGVINARTRRGRIAGNVAAIGATISRPDNVIVWTTLDAIRPVAPYLYWREVYRVPIPLGSPGTYYLGNYLAKHTFNLFNMVERGNTYGYFYGTPGSPDLGSIMVIQSDGKGNLTFNWRENWGLPGDEGVYDETVSNIKYLPYYYSARSSRVGRNLSLSVLSSTTPYLTGMTRGTVVTTTRDIPVNPPVPVYYDWYYGGNGGIGTVDGSF